MKRLVVAIALSAGCSTILGFEDGTRLPENEPCSGEDGTTETCHGRRICIQGVCKIPCAKDGCPAGLSCVFMTDSEGDRIVRSQHCERPGGSDAQADSHELLTTFAGAPRAITIVGDHLYYTSGDRVFACAKTGCDNGGTPVSDPGVFPKDVVRVEDGIAWADTSHVRRCSVKGTERCATTLTVDAPGVVALSPDRTHTAALWLQRAPDDASSLLTEWPVDGGPRTAAPVANWSSSAAIAPAGEDRYFVLLDGQLRSIAGGTSATITDEAHQNGGVPGLTVLGDRAVWILDREARASIFQCVVESAPSSPPALCNPGRIGQFAAVPGGEHITTLGGIGDVVYWTVIGASGTRLESCPLTRGGTSAEPAVPCPSTNRHLHGDFPERAVAMTFDETYVYVLGTEVRASVDAAPSSIRRLRR